MASRVLAHWQHQPGNAKKRKSVGSQHEWEWEWPQAPFPMVASKSIVHCRGPNSCGPVTGSVNAESDLSQWRVVLGVGLLVLVLNLDAHPQS